MFRTWLSDEVTPVFNRRVLPIDDTIARRVASLHVPNPAPEANAYIAATALVYDGVLATCNTGDFDRLPGLITVNLWVTATSAPA